MNLSRQQKRILLHCNQNTKATLKTFKADFYPDIYEDKGLILPSKYCKKYLTKINASLHRSVRRLLEKNILVKIDKYYVIHPSLL